MGLKTWTRTVLLNDDEQRCYAGLPAETPKIAESLPPRAVSVFDVWFEDTLGTDWVVAYRLALQHQDARVVVSEIRIFPAAQPREALSGRWSADLLGSRAACPPGGLKGRMLRQVRLLAFERELSAILKHFKLPFTFRGPARSGTGSKRGRKLDETRYAEIAIEYATHYEAASAHPTADTAKSLGLSLSAARAAVSKARRLNLLTATVQGERGGRATPRAHKLVSKTTPTSRRTK